MSARLVVLASGEGSTLQAVLDAAAEGSLGGCVVAVGSDRPGCRALQRATAAGVPTFARALADYPDRAAWDAELARRAGRMGAGPGRARPASCGCWRRPCSAASGSSTPIPRCCPPSRARTGCATRWPHGVQVTGVTITCVDAGVDTGPVLAQEPVRCRPDDDEASLHARIKAVERRCSSTTIGRMARGGWPTVTATGRRPPARPPGSRSRRRAGQRLRQDRPDRARPRAARGRRASWCPPGRPPPGSPRPACR